MDYVAMGRRIRNYRKKHGMTQAALAADIKVSTSFVGHIERGTRIASLETLVSLSETLGVSLDALVTGADLGTQVRADANYKMRLLNDVLRVLDKHSGEWLREENP